MNFLCLSMGVCFYPSLRGSSGMDWNQSADCKSHLFFFYRLFLKDRGRGPVKSIISGFFFPRKSLCGRGRTGGRGGRQI